MLHIPRIAYRRMAITNMQLIGTSNYSLGNSMTTTYNNIISRHIELFDCEHHKRQIISIFGFSLWELLDKRSVNLFVLNDFSIFILKKIHYAIQIGIGENFYNFSQYFFPSTGNN